MKDCACVRKPKQQTAGNCFNQLAKLHKKISTVVAYSNTTTKCIVSPELFLPTMACSLEILQLVEESDVKDRLLTSIDVSFLPILVN